jgi:hypothetical protein
MSLLALAMMLALLALSESTAVASTSTWLPGQKTVMIWCGVSTNETA